MPRASDAVRHRNNEQGNNNANKLLQQPAAARSVAELPDADQHGARPAFFRAVSLTLLGGAAYLGEAQTAYKSYFHLPARHGPRQYSSAPGAVDRYWHEADPPVEKYASRYCGQAALKKPVSEAAIE